MLAPASQHRLECCSRIRSAERGWRAVGALLYTRFSNDALTLTLGLLLLSTALATLVDLPSRVRVTRIVVGVLGLLSGLFGGLAGNQGGLRAAAMLSLSLSPVRYVATATATAMLVDIVADTDLRLARWRRAHDIGSSVECCDCGRVDRHCAG